MTDDNLSPAEARFRRAATARSLVLNLRADMARVSRILAEREAENPDQVPTYRPPKVSFRTIGRDGRMRGGSIDD